jgi:tetratricopeptide (TPR) repeat protein
MEPMSSKSTRYGCPRVVAQLSAIASSPFLRRLLKYYKEEQISRSGPSGSLMRRRLSLKFFLHILFLVVCPAVALLAQTNHIERAVNLLNQGDPDKAEAEARLALRSPSTKALAMAMLGTIRLQQAKYNQSIQFFNQALALNPKLVGARTSLGDAYIFIEKPALARKCFQEVLRQDPGNGMARFDLFKLEAAQRNFRQSLEIGRPMMQQLLTSDEAVAILASDYSALGKKNELAELVPHWQEIQAPSVDSALDFGAVLLANGFGNEAAQVFDSAERQLPPRPVSSVALRLANSFLAVGQLEKAEKNAQLALSIAPNCLECNKTLAAISVRQDNTEKALSYLVTARRLAPDNPEVLFQFGEVCLQRDLLDDAMPALTRAVELRPDNDAYVYALGSANVGKGNLPKALEIFQQLLRKHPNDPGLNYAIGAVYFLQADYSNAETALKQSLAAQPNQISAAYYLGLTYSVTGELDRAISMFRGLVKDHPQHAPSYIKLGGLLAKTQQQDEALQALQRGVELDPDSVEGHYQLGLLLRRLGKKDEGDAQLAESKKLGETQRAQKDVRLRLVFPD